MKMRKMTLNGEWPLVIPAIEAATALCFYLIWSKKKKRFTTLFLIRFLPVVLCLFLSIHAFAQECFNAGLEAGSLDGYTTYIGSIDTAGNVVIDDRRSDGQRHRVMHIDDGVDPIAAMFCDSLSNLPVVPEGGGKFSLRLGNEDSGGEAERVLLKFKVTPDLTFFLLRYAVILNDPGHEEFEQPRFEMRILDENGRVFPCGEYQVRAAENIPGFESCRAGWRVRPWTTAGFELQSYLGQTIQIEILTTDCSRGGHAGYAYFEGSCQALKLDLDGYCPGTTAARIGVTDGFTSYHWNTGDTTNVIEIDNPVEGDTYSVTVTSATGCTIVLEDKLPAVKDQPAPKFDPIPDTSVCAGGSIWLRPTGKNLNGIFNKELGITADSFLFTPASATKYSFSSSGINGCYSDSITVEVTIRTPEIDTAIITPVSCFGGKDGKIQIETSMDISTYQWSESSKGKDLESIGAGAYNVTITDYLGCTNTLQFIVVEPPPLVADQFDIHIVGCSEDGHSSVEVLPEGGVPPYAFNWSPNSSTTAVLTDLGPGTYSVTVEDANNCQTKGQTTIKQPLPLAVEVSQDSVSCSGGKDGQGILSISGGTPEYTIRWSDINAQQSAIATDLAPGTYFATVTDAGECTQTVSIDILEPTPLQISFSTDSTTCYGYSDGAAALSVSGGTPGYRYLWNDTLQQKSARANGLKAGIYAATVTDQNGCTLSTRMTVPHPPPVSLSVEIDSVSCALEHDGGATVIAATGTPPYTYYWLPPIGRTGPEVRQLEGGTYQLRITDGNGCIDDRSILVPEPAPITVNTIASFFPDCDRNIPGMAIVEAQGGNGVFDYFWENGNISDTLYSDQEGVFQVSVLDRKGCTGAGTVEINTFKIDLTSIGLSSDAEHPRKYLCLSDEVNLNMNANNKLRSIQWTAPTELNCDTCQRVSARPLSTMPFQVEVVDVFGCPAEAVTRVIVDQACGVYIPNAFSPNGDGVNDQFYVAGKNETLQVESFRVFSRWGELVFESCSNCPIENPGLGWNGKYRGKNADVGVYVYAVELSFMGMEAPVMFKGDVLLMR